LAVGTINVGLIAVVAWFVTIKLSTALAINLTMEVTMELHVNIRMAMHAVLWGPGGKQNHAKRQT
jgi:hypothetical protein